MDLLKLKYFYTVAKLEHVTKASEELHVAQPAITKCVKKLEDELGVKLLVRVGRNVKLTEYGKLLKDKLNGVFEVLDEIPTLIEKKKELRQKNIRLNVLSASIFTMETVVEYKNAHPEVVFTMIQFAERESSDINITTEPIDKNSAPPNKNRCVIEEKIFIAVSKSSKFADRKSITLKELKEEKFIYLAGSKTYRYVCDAFFEGLGYTPNISFETDSAITVKNIIGADAGIGFWPEHSWGSVENANVRLIPVTDVECRRNVIIELNESAGGGKHVREFFDYLTAQLKKRLNK